ncbi:MAG: transketolase [Clostridia bacterium]|nr:transketolase [Clostridia bacterium]
MPSKKKLSDIRATLLAAAEIRKGVIRALEAAGSGHIGGSMSLAEILAVLYTDILNVDPKNPKKRDRDYVVLSKGHCGPALYSALAYKGYFDPSELLTLNKGGTKLPSHCDRLKTTGIDISTGSLGQGLSLATGVALGKELQGIPGKVYAIVGDGELQEGQNWEAFLFLAHRKLTNLITIVDNNRRQLDGYVADICGEEDIAKKLEAFGFDVRRVNGHDVEEIYNALYDAGEGEKPTVVICDTEKGHGCCISEFDGFNHYMPVSHEDAAKAIEDIERRLEKAYEQLS